MMRFYRHIRFRVRWWRWFFSCPNTYRLIEIGTDRESRRILFDRWADAEPKREEQAFGA